ncbi:baculoviral IAP repeat-containing protein 2-like [Haliotis rubra]|uniref:baculoviral IAP repeat-containing protein 2-like n=1 Tax=Haliotis rubra TaxID=36100 RepID=UPI001EE5B52A|nr:baculoviral IAP repeat-containing protein 2-like [Haliotis rubra]
MSFFSSYCKVGSASCDRDDTATEMATAEMMRHETMRLMTYTKWPSSSSQDPARLAEAGFFYTGSGDRVKCAFCLGVLKMWKLDDIPLTEHQSHFPYCRFLQGKEVGNIPLSQGNPKEVAETTYQGRGNSHALVPCCEIQGSVLPNAHTSTEEALAGTSGLPLKPPQDIILPSEALNTLSNIQNKAPSEVPSPFEVPSPPIVPDFTREVHRLATFSKWPEESTVSPEDLARAGFYHEPQDTKPDRVKCGYCRGKVYGWQAGDDPWMEHARCFPTCPYIRLCLGEEMLQDITAYMVESGSC